MRLPILLERTLAPARQQWQQLTPTGKRNITIASIFLAIGLGWAFIYEPLQSSLKRNRLGIAEASSQASRMRDQAAEVARIRATAPVAATTNITVADVAGLQAILGPQSVVSLANSAKAGVSFKITLSTLPYATLIDRLEQATAKYRVRIASLALTRDPAASTNGAATKLVSGEVILVDVR
jgi:type II secretory pathway component PulM